MQKAPEVGSMPAGDGVAYMKWLYTALGIIGLIGSVFIAEGSKTSGVGRTVLYLLLPATITGILFWLGEFPSILVGVLVSLPFYLIAINSTKGMINVLLYVLPLVLVFGGLALWEARDEAILERGLPASAKVLEVRDLNTNIGVDPLISLRLQVFPPNGSPYETETKLVVSRLAMAYYRPGITVSVKYDPKKPKRVVVESIQSAGLP